ncbi:MAG: tRNA (adenosine(37)-N6)-threonylcarbamoyltransferase complex transferase subunit TsaD [Chthoniobacterales bacterium]|nr:tRNA (adenosine(37)-N6)-threonylcarbamoyltransferase complex transferase subunit TsaD [Chthoniobacterales bacterium]
MNDPLVLALETSCDETAAAILQGPDRLRASVISSQAALHAAYGGVVPEVASRNHLASIRQVVAGAMEQAGVRLDKIDFFAATNGPGLASALLVGLSAAKGLAIALEKPFLAVNHVEGHLLSPFFGQKEIPPSVGLVVSGGHTLLVDIEAAGRYRLLGRTLDDAAGEAFDKVAKLLGLGYPGGPEIEARARLGDAERFNFPRGMKDSGDFNFSFSGLKTAVRYMQPETSSGDIADLCASFQEAVVDVLAHKAVGAAIQCRRNLIAVSGGVCLNKRLRGELLSRARAAGVEVVFAAPEFCADNAAMIAYTAMQHWRRGASSRLETDIFPTLGDDLFGSR